MERLWAGWRMTYIKGLDGHGAPCLFCGLKDQKASARTMILEFGETMYLVLNAYPYNVGHMMVVPKRHVATLNDLTAQDDGVVGAMVRRAAVYCATSSACVLVTRGSATTVKRRARVSPPMMRRTPYSPGGTHGPRSVP